MTDSDGVFLLLVLQITPASSLWPQLCTPMALAGQPYNCDSTPVQLRLSSQIEPVPAPKVAEVEIAAPVRKKNNKNEIVGISPFVRVSIRRMG